MKMKDAVDQFSDWRKFKVKSQTIRGYDRELRNFSLFLRNPEIENIRINDVMEYLNGMREMGWNHNSFIGKCMSLRKFFEFYRLQGYPVLNEELIPIPRKEYNIPRVTDNMTYGKLLSVIPVDTKDSRHIRNLAIINMLWDTGARNNEIMSLDISDLDLERKRAVIKTEKSRGRRPLREIFWTDATNDNIKIWLRKREQLAEKIAMNEPEALFVSATSIKVGQRFTIKGTGEMLRRYSNKAGIPCVNAHSLRHHMGHDIIHKGGSAADVANILGHSSLASSSIYTMMNDQELESRYRSFKGN